MRLIDETGNRYGKWIVIRRIEHLRGHHALWLCRCDCGTERIVLGVNLRSGHTKSCGCLKIALASLPKGEAAFNRIFAGMVHTAKRQKHERQLTKEQVRTLTKRACYYCGTKPNQGSSYLGYNGVYLYNGIDRVDSDRGYLIDNIVPCCKFCNYAKHNRTIEQFKTWVRSIYEHFGKV